MQIFNNVLTNVLASLYQEFFSALVFAFLFMFLYMFAQQNGGFKRAIKIFLTNFQKHKSYRYVFYFAFYCAMILFRTLLCRQLWVDPLNNVLGSWSLYDTEGHIQTEGIENFILFIPFTILYFWMISQMKEYKARWILVHSITYSFLFSICIEFLQLLLKLGSFQLSDIFYNTLGGFVGGIIYVCAHKKSDHENKEGKEEV